MRSCKKTKLNSVVKKLLFGALAIGLMGFTGCSSGQESSVASGDTVISKETGSAGESLPQNVQLVVNAAHRQIKKDGNLRVRVANIEKAEKEVTQYVKSNGGFISASSTTNLTENAPSIQMTIRIPVNLFDSTMSQFEALGIRLDKSVRGEDVTGQLIDLESRIKSMQAEEQAYRSILLNAKKVNDVLDVQSRIMKIRQEIEAAAAQRKGLAELAALSTIELNLVQETAGLSRAQDKNWAKESWNGATSMLGVAIQSLGSFAIFLLVFSPFWIPPILLVVWLSKRSSKKQAEKSS